MSPEQWVVLAYAIVGGGMLGWLSRSILAKQEISERDGVVFQRGCERDTATLRADAYRKSWLDVLDRLSVVERQCDRLRDEVAPLRKVADRTKALLSGPAVQGEFREAREAVRELEEFDSKGRTT